MDYSKRYIISKENRYKSYHVKLHLGPLKSGCMLFTITFIKWNNIKNNNQFKTKNKDKETTYSIDNVKSFKLKKIAAMSRLIYILLM